MARCFASIFSALTLVFLALPLLAASQVQAGQKVALELVLAVDCSSSVSPEEFALQMNGFADAFRDPSVLAALQEGGAQGVAISMIHWSGVSLQRTAIDWTLLYDAADGLAFADLIDATPRVVEGGPTAVGTAIQVATRMLEENDLEGSRRVIDVSGDGRANQGVPAAAARVAANRLGITINGLAILNEEPDLDRYYLIGVVGGGSSFLITAEDYEAFAQAIRRKLYFEITGPPVAGLPALPGWDESAALGQMTGKWSSDKGSP